jgi:hypothetical protein
MKIIYFKKWQLTLHCSERADNTSLYFASHRDVKGDSMSLSINPLTANDLKSGRAVSTLKLISPVKICMKNQQIHQLFIQFINYVW